MTHDAYRGARVLVLGGSGFIGAWTARELLALGASVTVAARDAAGTAAALGAAASSARIVTADLEQAPEVAQLVRTARPAVVFNLAGYGVDRTERSVDHMRAMGPGLVAALCQALSAQPEAEWPGHRLVHTGSGAEYGRANGRVDAATMAAPVTDYGRAKWEATQQVQAWSAATGLRAVVARLFTVYGPGEPSDRLLPILMRTARTGVPLALTSGRQRRDFTYIADVVDGLLRLGISRASAGDVVNLATGRLSSVREFVETAAAVLGMPSSCLQFGALPDRDDETWHGEVDLTRLRDVTGWAPPTSIRRGVQLSKDWTHVDRLQHS